jgi:hypothetical protein
MPKATGRTCPMCGTFHKFGEFPTECQTSYGNHVKNVMLGLVPRSKKTIATRPQPVIFYKQLGLHNKPSE